MMHRFKAYILLATWLLLLLHSLIPHHHHGLNKPVCHGSEAHSANCCMGSTEKNHHDHDFVCHLSDGFSKAPSSAVFVHSSPVFTVFVPSDFYIPHLYQGNSFFPSPELPSSGLRAPPSFV